MDHFWNFFENFHIFVSITSINLRFFGIKEYRCTKTAFFCHLHTLIDRKMEKFDSFSSKKFKLVFRVPNNCAVFIDVVELTLSL